MYLDDVTLGGSVDVVMEDLDIIEWAADDLGLHLNHLKSEVICEEGTCATSAQSILPGAQWVDPASSTVLGSSVVGYYTALDQPHVFSHLVLGLMMWN